MSHKYDLLTVDTTHGGPLKHFPWYKERLKLKHLKTSKLCRTLDGAKWRFVATDIDDFRTGAPLKGASTVTKNQVDPVPIVEQRSVEYLSKKQSKKSPPRMILKNPGHRTLYSKKGPRQQIKKEHMNSVEDSLLRHPLLLYPHLEDAIPVDIIDDVADILDPEMNELLTNSESTCSTNNSQYVMPRSKYPLSQQILIHAPFSQEEDTTFKEEKIESGNIYRFPLVKTEAEKEMEQNLIASQQVISAKQQSRVKQVTRDLVQWAEQLGGSEESAYIDEQTIKSLFGSNYETKPILMAPIQVVDLTSMPPELRADTASSCTNKRKSPKVTSINYYGYQRMGPKATEKWPCLDVTIPHVMRTKYGAWYLPVDLWRQRASDEPLKDPDLEYSALEREQATQKREMDEKIGALHGARAFKEFVMGTSKQGNMPSFLKSVKLHTPPSQSRRNTLVIK